MFQLNLHFVIERRTMNDEKYKSLDNKMVVCCLMSFMDDDIPLSSMTYIIQNIDIF